MGLIDIRKFCPLTRSGVFAAIPVILIGCGGGVSEEKFAEAVNNLRVAQSEFQMTELRVELLESDK